MGEGSQELHGPDLMVGASLEDLPVGGVLEGHADGEAVLMYRDAEGVHAVSGICTHYGGPLMEGVVEGSVIRCPWHHACFSLRTGEALAAPALNPLQRWRTQVAEGSVRITGREEQGAGSGVAMGGSDTVVIVGAGAAGSAAAETLRGEGFGGRVVLIDPDETAPYDRPNLSKDYLAGNAPEEWLPLRTAEFYETSGIERRFDSAVSLDVEGRKVLLSSGEQVPFTSLVLAMGAEPIRPPLPGADSRHVHVLRSLQDCRRLIEAARSARRVVVVGASFIGMEAASSLRQRGLDVAVVAPERVPFEKTLGAELGRLLQSVHEQHGVTFHAGRRLAAIHERAVELDDGSLVEGDMVLLGVGVRPRTGLAEAARLGGHDGVPVNEFLETRVAGIYAVGDLASYPEVRAQRNVRIEHWVVAQRQGQTAARNIMGRREAFTSVPFFWTAQFGLTIRYVGRASTWDAVDVSGSPEARDCAVRFLSDRTVRAVATIGRDRECLDAELAFEREAGAAGVEHGG